MFWTQVPTLTAEDLKKKLDAKEEVFILDVREKGEWDICRLPGAVLIPLAELPERFKELDPGRETVVHCKGGGRSARAVKFLQKQGFKKVFNLEGGVDAWAERVDPSMPTY